MQANIEAVEAGIDAFRRGDIPALLDLCTDTVEVTFVTDHPAIPFAGTWKGKEEVADYFRTIAETVEVLQWQPQHILPSGNHVVAIVLSSFRAKATGDQIIDTPIAMHFTAENGKITGWKVYSDTAALVRSLTAAPLPFV